MSTPPTISVRPYRAADGPSWLRCRVLAFLSTAYFDDVVTTKPAVARGVELVAVADGQVVGLLDMSVDGARATLECLAVHPDHQRRQIASRLFARGCAHAAALGATDVEAWTRDDEAAAAWYAGQGFAEAFAYLHVYAGDGDDATAALRAEPGLVPARAFFHVVDLTRESELRARFERVHRCRRLERATARPPAV